jgi:hypothetical protein
MNVPPHRLKQVTWRWHDNPQITAPGQASSTNYRTRPGELHKSFPASRLLGAHSCLCPFLVRLFRKNKISFAVVLGSNFFVEIPFERAIVGCTVLVLTCYQRPESVVQPDVRRSKLPGSPRLGCLN